MANPSDFDLTITGPLPRLEELKAFLMTAIEVAYKGGYGWGKYNLLPEKLFSDIDPDREHTWIGLARRQEHAIIGPENDCMKLEGSVKHAPPYNFVVRLSRKYPDLKFRLRATTNDTDITVWEIVNGVSKLHELWCQAIWDDMTIYFVRDGIRLPVPEIVDDSIDCDYHGRGPNVFIPEDLVKAQSEFNWEYLDSECPGVENGRLLERLKEICQSRAERFPPQMETKNIVGGSGDAIDHAEQEMTTEEFIQRFEEQIEDEE